MLLSSVTDTQPLGKILNLFFFNSQRFATFSLSNNKSACFFNLKFSFINLASDVLDIVGRGANGLEERQCGSDGKL